MIRMPFRSPPPFSQSSRWERWRVQMRAINPRDPGSWPLVPRLVLCLAVVAAIVGAAWIGLISANSGELQQAQAQEIQLKADYSRKLGQAINLDALRKQREQVLVHVQLLEKQLPGRAEMDALLSDINQAGRGRNLSFELFRPGPVVVRDHYAEQPIALKVSGRYHDVGAFAADIAHLSRIVTLNQLIVLPGRDGQLTLEATAKTFRYLDVDELAAQRKAAVASTPARDAGGRS